MIIEIREEARGDLHTGYRFYEEQASGLGRYFLECIFADIDNLRQFAGIHESVDGFQRKLSKRFPYAIFYEVVGNVVRISAILDCRRDPDSIHKRLQSPRGTSS
jgi:plasmid stabilization system protein ParE